MVILFDGICSLCNGFVRFVLKRDKDKICQFASLQSTYGVGLTTKFNIPVVVPKTMILYRNGVVLTESDAVIEIVSSLGGMWKVILVGKIVPRFIRNSMYRLVARNRYRLFGKKDKCMVPDEGVKDRFLDNIVFAK